MLHFHFDRDSIFCGDPLKIYIQIYIQKELVLSKKKAGTESSRLALFKFVLS